MAFGLNKEVDTAILKYTPANCTDPSSPIRTLPALTSLQGFHSNNHQCSSLTPLHVSTVVHNPLSVNPHNT